MAQEAVLWVDRLVPGGDGLAELDGLKVFVRFGAPQERVRARIVERKPDYAVAEIVDVLEPSPLRVEPRCRYYGQCGGCQLQHLSYPGQLVVKKLLVNDALQRVGRVFVPVHNITNHSPQWHYRNKSQFPVTSRVGFYRRRSHDVLEIEECLLHPVEFDRVRRALAEAMVKNGEPGYDESRHTGNIRHLVVRKAEPDGGLLVTVVTRTQYLNPGVWEALAQVENVSGVVQSINPARTNRILGTRTRLLAGSDHLHQTVLGKPFRVSAHSFFQVNISQAEELCRKVLKFVNPEGSETVLDLYCGVGMLSLIVAPFVKQVIGIDLDEMAIMDAQENRKLHGADNAQFICRDVDSDWPELKPDVIILDPPRKGCSPETLKRIVRLAPNRIVYVSCNPATLGRDLGLLEQMNYTTREVEPVDMFPQTFHVETVALVMPVWA